MEFTGDEKRIQALFSELALDDQSYAPRFEKLWSRAKTTTPARKTLVMRFTMITAAMLAGVCLIAIWSWYRSSHLEQAATIPPQIIPESRVRQPEQLLSTTPKEPRPVRTRRPLRQRQIERAAIRQAALLSKWQSPTNILMNSPTASVLSSLPKLNQSARDLEQFLPKNNDVMKESKQ